MLLASAAALPVLLATAGCRSSDVFAGPDPLAGLPSLSPDVITLQAVIAAEQAMIRPVPGRRRRRLRGRIRRPDREGCSKALLAQHQQHLGQLRTRLVEPAGAAPRRRLRRPRPVAGPA